MAGQTRGVGPKSGEPGLATVARELRARARGDLRSAKVKPSGADWSPNAAPPAGTRSTEAQTRRQLADYATALANRESHRLLQTQQALKEVGLRPELASEPGVAESVRLGVQRQLVELHGGKRTGVGAAVRAFSGRSAQLDDALDALGLERARVGLDVERSIVELANATRRAGEARLKPGRGRTPKALANDRAQRRSALAAAFGPPPKRTGLHVLVTMDAAKADPQRNPKAHEYLLDLYRRGMTQARVNNAHDTEATRERMAQAGLRAGYTHMLEARRSPTERQELLEALTAKAKELSLRTDAPPSSPPEQLEWIARTLADVPALRRAMQAAGKLADGPRIISDLAGQKLRTGENAPETGVLAVGPKRDERGTRLDPGSATRVQFSFVSERSALGDAMRPHVVGLRMNEAQRQAVAAALEASEAAPRTPGAPSGLVLELGEADSVGRGPRGFQVDHVLRGADGREIVGVEGAFVEKSYLSEGAALTVTTAGRGGRSSVLELGRVAALPERPGAVEVRDGETLVIKADADFQGRPAAGNEPAAIGTQFPEALRFVAVDHRVLIDDGKISAVVTEVRRGPGGEVTEIVTRVGRSNAGAGAAVYKIGAEKGMNFPDTKVDIPALSDMDREALPFVLKYVDGVAYSFVQSAKDVADLVAAMKKTAVDQGLATKETVDEFLKGRGICAKIETPLAMANLEQIMLAIKGFGFAPSAMIARGDLAVELGFDRIAEAQTELVRRLHAMGFPVIFATQVMEGMAKTGLDYSRSDRTDLHFGVEAGADSVMLNKGPGIPDVVKATADLGERLRGELPSSPP